MVRRSTQPQAAHPLDVVVRRMRSLSVLSEPEQELLRGLGARSEQFAMNDCLVAEGAMAGRPRFILSGWACRQRVLSDGRRQIFGFLLPGDGIGLSRRVAPELATIAAVTAMETVDAVPVMEAVQRGRAPGLARALTLYEQLEDGLLFDQIVRLGRQTASERVVHFLLELQRRLEASGLGDGQRFPMPLTQENLADTLGLSLVHLNRTLQQLRRDGLIALRSGVAVLLEREALVRIADYRAEQPTPPKRRGAEGAVQH